MSQRDPFSAFRFDPAGYRRLSTGSDGMRKCKVRICELMTAGVVLSRLIATKQKLKFVLGRAAGSPYMFTARLLKAAAFMSHLIRRDVTDFVRFQDLAVKRS